SKITVLHGEVETVERAGGDYKLRVAGDWIATGQLVLACESHIASLLTTSIDPALSDLLASIPYRSSTVIALGFEPGGFSQPLEGFGFLVPRRDRRLLVACTFMGTKFAFRVPENKILLRCFVSGAPDSSSLVPSVLEELREMIGLTA